MILVYFLWFCFLYSYFYFSSKSEDTFSPVKFVSLKYAFFNLPFILFIYFNPDRFYTSILEVCNVSLEESFFIYTIVQTIAFLSLVFGIKMGSNNSVQLRKKSFENYHALKIISILFFLIGIVAYLFFLRSVGGIVFLLENLTDRGNILSGQLVLNFLPFLTLSVLFLMKCISINKRTFDKILLFLFVMLSVLIFSSLGGRKNTLYLVITILIGYHYFFNKIIFSKIKKSKLVLMGFFLALYIVVIPALRDKDGFEKFMSKKIDLVELLNIEDLVYSISYTYIDIFASNYFNSDNAWYMSSSLDILENVVNYEKRKELLPPLDDGVYFRTINEYGRHYEPPVSRSRLFYSSWPIENFGFAYANLLIFGTVIFFFLQGRVYKFAYKLLMNNINNPVNVFFYVFIIFNFNFSNLRIIQLILLLPILIFSLFLFKMFTVKK